MTAAASVLLAASSSSSSVAHQHILRHLPCMRSGFGFRLIALSKQYNEYFDGETDRHRDRYRDRDRDGGRAPSGYRSASNQQANFLSELLTGGGGSKQLGALLLAVGLLLTVMGMMLFFEGNLLRLGNISLLGGIFLLIGPDKLGAFFLKESRMQATIITSIGALLVLFGRPRIGFVIEVFGLLNLFGNMFPLLLAVGRRLPIIGDIITAVEDSFGNSPPPYNGGNGGNRRYNPEF